MQGEVRVPTCQALLACVDGVGVILLAGKLDAFAADEPYELRSKAVEVAYEEIGLETCGKAMRKAAVNGDEEITGGVTIGQVICPTPGTGTQDVAGAAHARSPSSMSSRNSWLAVSISGAAIIAETTE